ncbi:MAG: hypothetical protein M0Z46_11100 [Actinomycetota bacterium]|nr:hypothetical protein [Actinomycetota bacterium]
MPPTTTTAPTPPPSVPNGPLAHFLAHPDAWWRDLGHHLAHIGEAVLPAGVALLAGLTALVIAWALFRTVARLRPPAARQLVEVSLPAGVEPKGALAFWRNLHPVLAGRSRLLHPPRHVAFEIEASEGGIRLRLWTPAGVPALAVARAVSSAWPGAQCQVRRASGPLLPGPLVSCGELRLAAPAWLALGTDHGVDPLRVVLGALCVDAAGAHGVVQVLARPASNRRAAVIGLAARSLSTGRPIAPVPRLLAAWRTAPPAPMRPDPMRSADARHALDKAIDLPAFVVVVRFGVSGHGSGRAARRRLGARAHELTAAFGVYAGRNHFVPYRRPGCRRHLERRVMGRGQVLGLSELAALAHLPYDEMVPGLAYAAAAAVAPPPGIVSGNWQRAIEEDDDDWL